MKKFLLILMFFVPFFLFADLGQNGISLAPDGTELKWEEGAWDFFIMHKTLIDHVTGEANKQTDGLGGVTDTTAQNPQGDTFINSSTYTLTSKHIPPDANIDRAFLAWLSTQDPNNLAGPTDNSVTLTFKNQSDPEITLTKEITASMQGNLASTTIGNFEYEALNDKGNTGVYTYRVEVSDFMKEIIKMGEAKGMNSGEALYGEYTVSGMDGSNDEKYLETSGLVGGWFMPFVYTSAHINPKKIYFYNGLAAYRFLETPITVSGFELPAEAVIKLGLVVFEGDPGLAMTAKVDNDTNQVIIPYQKAEPEGLYISGQSDPNNFAPMFNNCNPPKTINDTYSSALAGGWGPLDYTEMFNSISSVFSWEDTSNYWCVGNPNQLWPMDMSNPLEYAIDADILMVDAGPEGPFYGRFNKGDTMLNLKIGANQDQVYTNLLIISVDTKAPKFDIPETLPDKSPNTKTPNGREKDYCSCSTDENAVCSDRPFYYTIKIQNWGDNQASNVTLQDTLPAQVDYVPGTTEIATKFDEKGNGTDWTTVPDVNGGFPYTTAQKITDTMTQHCDKLNNPGYCSEGYWVRFQVKPKANLSKNEIIRNTAVITGDGMPYNSNSNIPLRLKLGNCPAVTECELPPKTQCGGIRIEGNDNYCAEDKDCKDGKKCKNNECVLDASSNLTSGAKVSFDLGKNSPGSGDSNEIFIPSPTEKLVLGQFYLISEGNEEGKFFEFHTVELKLTKDADIFAGNFKLYKDNNGDGKVDAGDTEIASTESLKNDTFIDFSITDAANRLVNADNLQHNFIVTADVETTAKSGQPGKFNMAIEGIESFNIKDSGQLVLTGKRTEFATYRFEPTEGFVFTKGQYDPQAPAYKDFNGEHEILQVRTKSIGVADKIKTIKVKTPSSFVKFGEGIKSISLILDRDGNGIQSDGDTVIQKIDSFESNSSMSFENLEDFLQYSENEEKFLIFKVEFKMSVGEKAKISVSDVKVGSGKAVGTPVTSKEFIYECDSTDPNSCASDSDDEGGCAISAVSDSDSSTLYLVFAAFAALLALAGVKVFAAKK
ncbi:DUF11 domain-containing protein [bacterium]|nr:DUF11 domain-containing protein [bacterium]